MRPPSTSPPIRSPKNTPRRPAKIAEFFWRVPARIGFADASGTPRPFVFENTWSPANPPISTPAWAAVVPSTSVPTKAATKRVIARGFRPGSPYEARARDPRNGDLAGSPAPDGPFGQLQHVAGGRVRDAPGGGQVDHAAEPDLGAAAGQRGLVEAREEVADTDDRPRRAG